VRSVHLVVEGEHVCAFGGRFHNERTEAPGDLLKLENWGSLTSETLFPTTASIRSSSLTSTVSLPCTEVPDAMSSDPVNAPRRRVRKAFGLSQTPVPVHRGATRSRQVISTRT
jgi:hypothetical protein